MLRRYGLTVAGILMAATPVLAALSRPVVQLDGDPNSSPLDSEDVLLRRTDSGREFGSAVAVCDVDGDHFGDVVIGYREAGRVFVYLGDASLRTVPWFDNPAAADIVVTAPGGGADGVEGFGFSVACADLDRDGFDDIVVGAPFSDPGAATDAGRAFVILGGGFLATGQNFPIGTPPAGVAVLSLHRGAEARAGDLLGFALATGGLGATDRWLAVSARDADAAGPVRNAAGAVHVVRGSSLPDTSGPFDLDAGSATTFFGPDASDAFGEALAGCDFDNGGSDDLVVGVLFGDGPAGEGINRGEVRVFLGENVASGFFSGDRDGSQADLSIFGATNGDDFGFSVACGDLDGDLRGEIVAGAVYADSVGELRPTAGEVTVLRGRDSAPDPNTPTRRRLIDPATSAPQGPINLAVAGGDLTLLGATTADQLGFAVAVGDLDGDGFGDLIASARRYDADQTRVNVGATYIREGGSSILGSPGTRLTIDLRAGTNRPVDPAFDPDPNIGIVHADPNVVGIVIGADREDHSGFALAAGNLDGRDTDPNMRGDELLIGAIGDPSVSAFRGEVYVMAYGDRDGDGASDMRDGDNDNDGISDADETAGSFSNLPTDPFDNDSDGDGIQDGTELRFTCEGNGGLHEAACDDPNTPYTSTDDTLALFFREDADPNAGTDPKDFDSDDDGLADGVEDANKNGDATEANESNPRNHDTDGDGIFDGTESGLFGAQHPDTNLAANHFVEDADHGASKTLPWDSDTDNDGIDDGVEDVDKNGAVAGDIGLDHVIPPMSSEIWLELDPADADTDRDGLDDGREMTLGSNPLDQDTDDDGLPDGWIDGANGGPVGGRDGREGEDLDGSGTIGLTESHPTNPDTDNDGLGDGKERGLRAGVDAGVPGRNLTPDAGPGGDGTDPTSANRSFDADGGACILPPDDCSVTLPNSADSDRDGILDNIEDEDKDGAVKGDLNFNYVPDPAEIWTETQPNHPDSDRDGLPDGREDANKDGILDPLESDPVDQDTDDDGLPDGWIDMANGGPMGGRDPQEGEDLDRDGVFGTNDGESHPRLTDSDGDGVSDGVEVGMRMGGGVPGRDGMVDGGPGGDGTDPNSPAFRVDADPNSTTFPWDADHDDDGLPDGLVPGFNPNPGDPNGMIPEFQGEDIDGDGIKDPDETDPTNRDTDGDGVKDGAERGVAAPGYLGPDMMADDPNGIGVQDGTRTGANALDADETTLTNPLDNDTDDDGFSDGNEDTNENGRRDAGGVACMDAETDATRFDTDADGLSDGLECGLDGVNPPLPSGTDTGVFDADLDPNSKTDPGLGDTDGGSVADGDEDANRNGRLDDGETDPTSGTDDDRTGAFEFTDTLNGNVITTIAPGSPLFIRLIDQDQDPDPNTFPTVVVQCESTFPDGENVPLQDNEPAVRGRFLGMVPTSTTGSLVNDGTLSVSSSSTITCTYPDPDDVGDVRTAQIAATLAGSLLPEPHLLLQKDRTLAWSAPGSPAAGLRWNVYGGNLAVLRQSGVYTQAILACDLDAPAFDAADAAAIGDIRFYLVTATASGAEGALGRDSAGQPLPMSQSCAP